MLNIGINNLTLALVLAIAFIVFFAEKKLSISLVLYSLVLFFWILFERLLSVLTFNAIEMKYILGLLCLVYILLKEFVLWSFAILALANLFTHTRKKPCTEFVATNKGQNIVIKKYKVIRKVIARQAPVLKLQSKLLC